MSHDDYVLLSYLCGALALIAISWQTYALWRKYYHITKHEDKE